MVIRSNLWPTLVNGKYKKRDAHYTFKLDGKKGFLNWLQGVKFPDKYAIHISRHVKMEVWQTLFPNDLTIAITNRRLGKEKKPFNEPTL